MLKDVLSSDFIRTKVKASSWQQAVHECGNLLMAQNKITQTYVDSMVDTVKQFGPYMVLIPEIAMFHGKAGKGVNEICLSLVTFAQSIQFDDAEKKSIKAAFAFGALDQDSHVDLLGALAVLLQNETFVHLLRNGGDKDQLNQIIQNY